MTEDDWFDEALRELREKEPADSAEGEVDAGESATAADAEEPADTEPGDAAAATDAERPEPTAAEESEPTFEEPESPAREETEPTGPEEFEPGGEAEWELADAERAERTERGAASTGESAGLTDAARVDADLFSEPADGGFGANSADAPDADGQNDVFGFENAPRSDRTGGEDFANLGERGASPIGSAGEAKGARDEFGFANFDEGFDGGFGGSEFDEESFESNIDRVKIGIEGLDEMILGGVPERSLIAVIGSAGTGKTTFALQFLTEALRSGERAVYLTLEQSHDAILDTAEEKGWPFREYEAEGNLAVVSIDPIEMANSLASIRNELAYLIEEFDADRLVLDSVSLLEMMYDHPAKRRSEVFDFTRSLKEAGVTTMVTSEASEETPYASRYGVVEYLTDAVFILQYVRPDEFHETRLAVEIQKIRDANHSRETKPYDITNDGISVYRQANIF